MKTEKLNIPSILTLLNLFGGFCSIRMSIDGDFNLAAWFIIIAILCDGLDGRVARWTRSETAFGIQLDSLADMVSSGMAPVVLIYRVGLKDSNWLGGLLLFLYVFAGAYRLARYNLIQKDKSTTGFIGLPVPVAAMTISAFILFRPPFCFTPSEIWWYVLLVALSASMVSTIPYNWPKLVFNKGWLYTFRSVLFLLGTAFLILVPRWSMFPLFCVYIIAGVFSNRFSRIDRQ